MKIRKSMTLLVAMASCLLLASGCSSFMICQIEPVYQPQGHKALVTFYRSEDGPDGRVGIWNGEGFVGDIPRGGVVQYHTTPGKHMILCEAGNWTALDTYLQAGQHYVVKTNVTGDKKHIKAVLEPVVLGGDITRKTVYDWISESPAFGRRYESATKVPKKKRKGADRALENIRAGRLPVVQMSANDHI